MIISNTLHKILNSKMLYNVVYLLFIWNCTITLTVLLFRVVEIIDRTLAEVVEQGFPKDRIDAVLHSYELGLKHRYNVSIMYIVKGREGGW